MGSLFSLGVLKMKWLALIKLILEIISQLPLEQASVLSDEGIEQIVRQAIASDSQIGTLGLGDIDWEAAIPHIVALVKIFMAGLKAPEASI